eukprot:TRINITY_DN67209_c4_g2_i2.p1 TRINITY_DN67209_c4_g2~~TRINITY_DN67209_c4_g2_i2.p1  ORF type:complete len:102 (-),score=0.72 TRINITY_DN67209_c4_g2_i2:239-544(-)
MEAMQCLIVKATRGRLLIEDVQGQEAPSGVVLSDVQLKSCVTDNEERNQDALENNIRPFHNNHICNCHCRQAVQHTEALPEDASIWDDVMSVELDTPFPLN